MTISSIIYSQKRKTVFIYCLLVVLSLTMYNCNSTSKDIELQNELLFRSFENYINQLKIFRNEFGGIYQLPKQDFYLFGMGNRDKFLYKEGKLINALTGDLIFSWEVEEEKILPNEYTILLHTAAEGWINIKEDENGIWLNQNEEIKRINKKKSKIYLPDFKEYKYSEILKVLHQEILINILDSKPVPNYFVYHKPWRRDAAMMAMCLEYTGNLSLIKAWVLSLKEPYDYNNGQTQGKPESEADNLGQTLYLISLFSDTEHQLVVKIMDELKRWEQVEDGERYIKGRSDFQEVPVYQTKWLKYGLKKLNMQDTYAIPLIADNYSSLFWWDYKDRHLEGNSWRNDKYPYIGWARDHFHGRKKGLISDRIYPLTWETEASQAEYQGMHLIHKEYVEKKIAAPHTWHAAEVFLYLLEMK